MKRATIKRALARTIMATLLASSATYAAQQCGGGGYIKSVALNHYAFRATGVIGISVLHDDGHTANYYSFQYGDVDNSAEMRALLQLATTAFISQAHVNVDVDQECSYTYKEADGRLWVTRWKGLWLDSK